MAFTSGPASCTTPRARSTSSISPTSAPFATPFGPILGGTLDDVTVFDAAFTQFFFPGPAGVRQDQMPSTRREPGTDADGRATDARHARPVFAISR